MTAQKMAPARPLAVLDIDGTLTDTIPLHHAAFLSVMESFKFPNLDRNWAGYTHHTDTAIFEEAWLSAYGTNAASEHRQDFHTRLETAFARASSNVKIDEIAGARVFVGALRNGGWTVAFATGGLRELSKIKLTAVEIPFEEDVLVTASEYVTREELVAHAIVAAGEYYACKPSLIVSIGDGIWDLKTARLLGLPFLGIGTGPKADMLRDNGALVAPDFQDLPAVFEALDHICSSSLAKLS